MMRRSGVAGVLFGIIVATALSVSGQGPSPAQIQAAFRQAGLSGPGVYADSQVPTWDAASGKFLPGNGGGGGGAPSDAEYWVGAANGSLSAEKNLGALSTALVINTGGVPSAFTAQTCTNQVITALSAVGTATCTTVTSAYVDSSIGLTGSALSQFAATTSAQLAGVISDEISAGASPKLLFGDQALASTSSPTFNVLTVTSCTGCASGGANTALSNLASVAINTALLPSGAAIDLGSSSAPFRTGYLNTDLAFTSTTGTIRANTADASDNATVIVAAGGANGALRGASLQMYGNEHAQAGDAVLQIGGGTGGQFTVNGASAWLDIAGSSGLTTIAGATTFSTTVSVTGHTTFEGVTSTGATGTGKIVYDAAPTFSTSTTTPLAIFNATPGVIRQNTSDGSDSSIITIAGGGGTGVTRGAQVIVQGNDVAGGGTIKLAIGDTGGGNVRIVGSGGSDRVTFEDDGRIFMNANPASGAGDVFLCISTSNIVHQGATCAASAREFKQDIQPIGEIERGWFAALLPRSFNWKPEYYGGKHDVGFIADEVAAINPLYAIYQGGKPFSINDRAILSTTVGMVQWQQQQIARLEQRVTELEQERIHDTTNPLSGVRSQPVSARIN